MSGTAATCPECGTIAEADPGRRDAADFCPGCDFPLFWARPGDAAVTPEPGEGGDGAYRRAPGTLGAHGSGAEVPPTCPACAERNRLGEVTCWRCGEPLEPSAALTSEPTSAPPSDEPVPPAEEPEPIWGWWLVLAVGVLAWAFALAGWVPW